MEYLLYLYLPTRFNIKFYIFNKSFLIIKYFIVNNSFNKDSQRYITLTNNNEKHTTNLMYIIKSFFCIFENSICVTERESVSKRNSRENAVLLFWAIDFKLSVLNNLQKNCRCVFKLQKIFFFKQKNIYFILLMQQNKFLNFLLQILAFYKFIQLTICEVYCLKT